MPESKSFVSVVAIVRNDPGIRAFVTEVLDVLASHYADYELVLVDDGSADATPLLIQRVLAEQESVRLVRLSPAVARPDRSGERSVKPAPWSSAIRVFHSGSSVLSVGRPPR